MKRTVPLLILFLAGSLLIVASFIPYTEGWKKDIVVWFDVLAAIAFVLGGGNLLKMHLKKISDRRAGWGYSAVTLLAFGATLTLGLLKVGSSPAPVTEYYGWSTAELPLSAFPVTSVADGTIPRGRIPAVVKRQLEPGPRPETVTFHGWMTTAQREALDGFEYEAGWHRTVETLFEATRPPKSLRGRVQYSAQLLRFRFRGVMTPDDRDRLLALGDDPQWKAAVENVRTISNRTHSVPLQQLPAGIVIPPSLSRIVAFDSVNKQLWITGPMSSEQRDRLVQQFPPGTALTTAERTVLRRQLEQAGPLSPGQINVLDAFGLARPTIGQRNKALLFELLTPDDAEPSRTLNAAQRKLLLKDYNVEVAWKRTVNRLYRAAHKVQYPWSGPYNADGSAIWYIFEYAIWPLTSTMFALLAFYVASAAFRAFRAKNVGASLLLGTAFIILLGRTYAGTWLTAWLPPEWFDLTIPGLSVTIMSVFTTAGNRAIMIGIALGIASTSLKLLLGIDRSYLGSD